MAMVSIKRILITESVDPCCTKILQDNGIQVAEKKTMTKDELIAEIKDYDGLVIRSATKITEEIINAAVNLKIIGRAGTGVDNVDVDAATKRGIIVMNTPSGNTISAAELTCALLMCLSRGLPQAVMSMKAGNWDRKKFMGTELYGKILGIVGLGRIGKEVATRMQSFGMKTIGYDPITPPEISATWGVEQMSLEQLWPQCDYITVHTPLMPSTTGLLNDASFAKCKRGVKVVNCARGGIIDEAALLRALESGQCGGAGLDVFVEVNAHVLASTFSLDSHQWIKLGESLGLVLRACSASKQPYGQVQITTIGESLKNSVGFLGSAVMVGLLKESPNNSPNLVNVLTLAQEAGIMIIRNHADEDQKLAKSLCMVDISASGSRYKATGSVLGEVPVLLELNGSIFRQPIPLSGNLLFFKGMTTPQVLPSVAGILAAAGVVIESFSASVADNGDQWCCIGLSSLLGDLEALKPLVNEVTQVFV
ncbi:D-3-phosphoglycerate dehydrogenase isoform X2 [Anguilla rostrata]|uniref:D-3-phosphoglycerate dehydrogenase isoform X2 n=1 Tax=Anguilla rostrata TaxID=7938 RepID=UPI0030D34E85